MILWIIVPVALALLAYDIGRGCHCEVCHKSFGVFAITGQLARATRVCWGCRQKYHALTRNRR